MGLTFAQALKAERQASEPPQKALDVAAVRRVAKEAAEEFAETLKLLPRGEQVAIAEALIGKLGAVLKQLAKPVEKGYPEFNPDQARGEGGKWTVGGAASAAAGMAARGAGAVGRLALHAAREALATVTLVPSSKQAVGDALQSWWKRVQSDDSTTHIEAIQEGAGRLMATIVIGSLMVVVAHAVLGSAAGAVGAAVGQALRFALGKRAVLKGSADIGGKLELFLREIKELDGNGQHSPARARTLLTQLSHAQLMDGPAADLLSAVVDFGQAALHVREQVVKAYNPSQPRDARGRWTSAGGAGGAIGEIKVQVNAALDGIAAGTKSIEEAASDIKQAGAETKRGLMQRAVDWINSFEEDDQEQALDIAVQLTIIVGLALYAYFVGFPWPADMGGWFGR